MAQTAAWDHDSLLLELYGSLGGLALARALGCQVTVVEPDAKVLGQLQERARVAGVAEKVAFVLGDVLTTPGPTTSVHGIFTFSRVLGLPGPLARSFRPRLAERGRLGFLCVVKVGRTQVPEVVSAWERRLGGPLLLPRDALLEVEKEGFEPDLLETVGESELTDFYQTLDGLLRKADAPTGDGPTALGAEIALHQAHGGESGVTVAYVLARRKEPGEKPPLSRDSG
jgi:hypothetical protein